MIYVVSEYMYASIICYFDSWWETWKFLSNIVCNICAETSMWCKKWNKKGIQHVVDKVFYTDSKTNDWKFVMRQAEVNIVIVLDLMKNSRLWFFKAWLKLSEVKK